jgi:hypothetical protein
VPVSFHRAYESKVNETLALAGQFGVEKFFGFEIFDFGGDLAIKRRSVELSDRARAAFAGQKARPEFFNRIADWSDRAQTRYGYTPGGSHEDDTSVLSFV